MQRKAYDTLLSWSQSSNRKPLVVFGARQVGKSYLIKQFAQQEFDSWIYIDFEENPRIAAAFESSLDPQHIIESLGFIFDQPIIVGKTLLIFDEIQACNRAFTSLKYFYEKMPEQAIIAAGSNLGISVAQKDFSAPVGKVDMLTLYPMSFEEFLAASGKQNYLAELRNSFFDGRASLFHEELLGQYHLYLMVGGMPEMVQLFIDGNSLEEIRSAQSKLIEFYTADMAKYAAPYQVSNVMATWASIPRQLAKENKKFMYKEIRSGARANLYAYALDWLAACGLIYTSYNVTSADLPLKIHENVQAFKVFPLDIGLLSNQFGLRIEQLNNPTNQAQIDLGGLTESYVAQQLKAQNKPLHYWTSNNSAEIDFLYEGISKAIPIEVKSSINTRSKSLASYCNRYQPPISVRISPKSAGITKTDNLIHLACPLYAVFLLPELLEQLLKDQ